MNTTVHFKRSLWGLSFVLPSVIFFAIFAYYPIIRAAQFSFTEYNMLSAPINNGLDNYKFILNSERYQSILVNTFEFVAGYAIPTWIIGLMLALIFVQNFKGRAFYRTLYFVPVILSETVISVVWRLLFHQNGAMNAFISPFNSGAPIPWLTNSDVAPIAIIIVAVWRVFGYYMIIFITGLQSIPYEYYEAAYVDGAGPIDLFTHITFPLLRPTTVFVVIITLITGFQSFVYQFLLTRGGPNDSTNVIGYLIYQEAFSSRNMGRAAALSMMLFALLVVLTITQLYLLRERDTN